MKINDISLYNFGSYEGENTFKTHSSTDKNIVLVGGKNGAGKTTLFTAMRICLYGYMSMGYKNANAYYSKAVTKLINNNAKLTKPTKAAVSMNIDFKNTHGFDNYQLERKWLLTETLTESFAVSKNGVALSDDELADFEKYLLSLLPPELFNFYFFDGEKIADFFFNEGSATRIKNAFLTLCGYDTFDIMQKNFKRISTGSTSTTPEFSKYLLAKKELSNAQQKYEDTVLKLKSCTDEIHNCEAEITSLENNYRNSGGISMDEWNHKLAVIHDEEKKRESYNAFLKKCANDTVPFVMIKDCLLSLKQQIEDETNTLKYLNFCEVLDSKEIHDKLNGAAEEIKALAYQSFGNSVPSILKLSLEQNGLLMNQINHFISFDPTSISDCKKAIKKSISLSAKLRKEMEQSSISGVQEYMKKRAELFEEKSSLLVLQVELEKALVTQKEILANTEQEFAKIKGKLEEDLKKASINDISVRAVIMLDQLQEKLYRRQIDKVECFFRNEIKTLMRKTNFINDIYIDDKFNIHIYKTESISKEKLLLTLNSQTEDRLASVWGEKAISHLKELTKASDYKNIIIRLRNNQTQVFDLPVEIDKSSLSNGEKQIFIMALYHSLVNLCNNEVPFVIDTPFARIDTEHRHNISQHFFNKLNGQVFILSTDEEINSSHVQILSDKISATFMLQNSDNTKTRIESNTYFEV